MSIGPKVASSDDPTADPMVVKAKLHFDYTASTK